MKTPSEKRTELSAKKADMAATNILMNCINTALILLGIGFLLMKLTGRNEVDAYSITMFVLAAVIALVGLCAMAMFKSSVTKAVDESDEHI